MAVPMPPRAGAVSVFGLASRTTSIGRRPAPRSPALLGFASALVGRAVSCAASASSGAAASLPKRAKRPPQVHTDAFPTPAEVTLRTLAVVRSPYKERFGCPRQPTVTAGVLGGDAADGILDFQAEPDAKDKMRLALQDLDGFELLWVISHLHMNQGWSAKVTPPRGTGGTARGKAASHSLRPCELSGGR
ncbi:unnamed protein product [Effrenium voratum]|nr:unnamed protein product [Effrenium voratum]